LHEALRQSAALDQDVSRSFSIAFKRLAQSFHFKTGAKQREQASHQYHPAFNRQQDVGFRAQFRQMPENGTNR
jgi:hypothetical protein